MQQSQALNLSSKVMRARILFSNIAWRADQDVGGHWATPPELLKNGAGDLLDLVTAYYFTLRGMGVPATDIRMYLGQLHTLDRLVPHLLLAVRAPNQTIYFVDPIQDTPMIGEPPKGFQPTLALNETGTWWTPTLTDVSVWNTQGSNLIEVEGWARVCESTLDLLGLLPPAPPPPIENMVATLEADPPSAGMMKESPRRKGKNKRGR